MPIEVIDLLKQKNNGSFPLIEAKDVKGGFHQVNNIEERNTIPKEKRIEGMYCYVLNDTIYRLLGGIENSNWTAWNVATKQYVDNQINSVDTLLEGKADTSHVHGWNELTGKPSTFTPILGITSTTAFRGDYGNIAYTHSKSAHAPANAQKNSDITKAEIEAKIIGARLLDVIIRSANGIFNILEDGSVSTSFLSVDNELSTSTLTVKEINNPKYQQVLDEPVTVIINEGATTTSDVFEDDGVYSSFADFLAVAPRNLNGYTLTIQLGSNINGNITLSWFHSGQINLEFLGHTVYGWIYCYSASMVYRLYGNKAGSTGGTTVGKIMPPTGKLSNGYYYGLLFDYCKTMTYDLELYPDKTNGTTSCGIICVNHVDAYLSNVIAKGSMRYLVRSHSNSHVYVAKSSGRCNNATFCAVSGSVIRLNDENKQAGRDTTGNPYWSGSQGQVIYTGVTFDGASSSGSNTGSGTGSQTATVTKTVNSTGGDTYRSTYSSWKKDGTVRQGNAYGSGNCQGLWFFGSTLANALKTGTTKSVKITISRQSGGSSAAVTHILRGHNHTSQPSGAPTVGEEILRFSLATGKSITITLTSAQITILKKYKGIGIQSSYTSDYYSVCSGSATIKVTYEE